MHALKNNGENYPRKCFWTKEKETRVKLACEQALCLGKKIARRGTAQPKACSQARIKFNPGLSAKSALEQLGPGCYYMLHVCRQGSFGLPLRMNGMHRKQFDHALLDPLLLVIWSCVFWLSVMWNLCKVQRWSKSVLTFDHCLRNLWLYLFIKR